MTEEPVPKRIRLDSDEVNSLSREELIEKLRDQERLIRYLEKARSRSGDAGDDDGIRGSEEKLKQQNIEAARRENTLVIRLTNKEQELQDCLNQISEMKQAQTQSSAQLRTMLLDPALNLVFQRMAKEVDESKEKLKLTQNELSAWKFTPDSQTGKRLMAKCRMLLQENEELGKMIASGRTAKLEGEIALQKTLVQEMKKNQEELDEFVSDLEEDVEGMQSMIYVLQTQLKDTKEQLAKLHAENEHLRTLSNSNQHQNVDCPTANGGKHLVNHSAVSSKSETPELCDQNNKTAETTEAKSLSPPKDLINHSCTESQQQDSEPMDTDSPAQVSKDGGNGEKPPDGCDSGEVTRAATDRTTHANSHSSGSRVLSADSTSSQDHIDAESSDAWSPHNSRLEDHGAEDSLSVPEKAALHGNCDDPVASSEGKPVRNGMEAVTRLESGDDV